MPLTFKCSECGAKGHNECLCACSSCLKKGHLRGYIVSACPSCGGSGRFSCRQCGGAGYLYRKGWGKYALGRSVNDAVPAPWWAVFFFGQSPEISCSACVPLDGMGKPSKSVTGLVKRGQGFLKCNCQSGKVKSVCSSCGGTGRDSQCTRCHGKGRFQCPVCLGGGDFDLSAVVPRLPIVKNAFPLRDHTTEWEQKVRPCQPLGDRELREAILWTATERSSALWASLVGERDRHEALPGQCFHVELPQDKCIESALRVYHISDRAFALLAIGRPNSDDNWGHPAGYFDQGKNWVNRTNRN